MTNRLKKFVGFTTARFAIAAIALAFVSGQAIAQETSDEEKEIKVEHVDGKLIIVTGDGEKHEIDLSEITGAKGFVIKMNQEAGGGKTTRRGQAILVGPDGEQEVIFDSDAEGLLSFKFEGLPGEMQWQDLEHANMARKFQFN